MLLIDALKTAGYGRFHVMYYTVTVPLLMLCSANINLNIFIGYDPLHRCRLNDDYNVNWTAVQAHAAPSKQIIPGKTVFDACKVYSWYTTEGGAFYVNDTSKAKACPNGFQYLEGIGYTTVTEDAVDLNPNFGPTLMMDMNITCNSVWTWALPGLSSIAIWPIQPFALPFMDKIGRKSFLSIMLICSAITLALTPYAGSFWNVWVIRCISRVFVQVCYVAVTRHVVELHPMDERHCTTALLVSGYGSGHLFLVFLDWLFDSSWKKVDYAVAICTVVWTPVVILLYPESPLFWVVNANRENEAEKIIRRIAHWNRVKLPLNFTVDPSPMLTNCVTRTPARWHTYLIRSWNKIMFNPFVFRRWLYATLAWFVMNYVWVAASIVRMVSPLYFGRNYAFIGMSVVAGGFATQLLLRFFKKMEIATAFFFVASIAFFLDAGINAAEGGSGSLLVETPMYALRGVFFCVSAAIGLAALSVIRLQSAEVRAEECQPGAMFWLLFFGTPGGFIAMWYVKFTNFIPANPVALWVTPLLSGMLPLSMGVATLVWFFDIDYAEDCRWRDRAFQFVTRRRRISPAPLTERMRDRIVKIKRLSFTSSAAT